jgi:P-type Cu2+ transporter
VVLDVRGLQWASEQNVVAAVLGRRPGVLEVEVNAVAQAATVVFDPRRTSLAELRGWVMECGYHCAGQSVPAHACDPMAEPDMPGATGGRPRRPGPRETPPLRDPLIARQPIPRMRSWATEATARCPWRPW